MAVDMIVVNSRRIAVVLVLALLAPNLVLAATANTSLESENFYAPAARAPSSITQTSVVDWRAGTASNITISNESGGELSLQGFEIIDPGIAGITPLRDLEVDSRGNLYVGTQPGTVFRLDASSGTITDLGRPVPDEDNINRLMMDGNDTLWGGGRSFNGVTPNRGGIVWRMNTTSMRFDAAGKVEMVNNQIRGMCADRNGTIWAGNMNGVLARFDPTTGAVFRLNGGAALIPGSGIYRMEDAQNGFIYAGTANAGGGGRIIKIDPTTNTFTVLNGNNPVVNGEGIQALAVASNGTIYGGTSGGNIGNIFAINTSTDMITVLGKALPGDGSIGDLYPAKDGSVYGTAGGGTLPDFHLFRIENGTGAVTDIGIPFPGSAFPSMLAVAPDGTVYGIGSNQLIYKLAPEYAKSPSARLNRVSTGRIFTENFELSDINWDWAASGGPVNFIRTTDASRPVDDQTVYMETLENSGASNARAGSIGPSAWYPDAFPGFPASVYEITFKMNHGTGAFCGTRLYMNYYGVNQNYILWFIKGDVTSNDTIVLLRDGVWIANTTTVPLDHGCWYTVKWETYHVGNAGAFNVWVNGTKIFDEIPIVAPTRQSGSIILGSRVANVSFDGVRLYKDTNITVNGLQAGQKVLLYATNGTLVSNRTTAGASVILNVNQSSFPMAGYFNITDTAGAIVNYTSPVYSDVYGGDTYALTSLPLGTMRYFNSGTYLSRMLDTGYTVNWTNLRFTSNNTGTGNVTLMTRTADTAAGLASAPWSALYNVSPAPINSSDSRWIQFEATLNTLLPASSPELRDATVEYTVFPNYSVSLSQSTATLYPGDIINYTIVFDQTGNGIARDTVITDILPAGLNFLNSTQEPARNGSVWTFHDLPPGHHGIVEIQAAVALDASDNRSFSNRATVGFTDGDGALTGNYNTQTVTARVGAPVVDFGLTVPGSCVQGELFNWSLQYNNTGSAQCRDLWVNFTLDPDLTLVNSSNEAARHNTSWHFLQFSGRDILTFTAIVSPIASEGDRLSIQGSYTYSMPNGIVAPPLNAGPSLTVVKVPRLEIAKNVDLQTAYPSDELNYTIFINNTGNTTVAGALLYDALPAGLEMLWSQPPVNYTDGRWTFGAITPGSSRQVRIGTRIGTIVAEGTVLRNRASVNCTTGLGYILPGVLSNEVQTTVGKSSLPEITVSLSADRTTVFWNETVNYTLGYSNTGNATAKYAEVTVSLPSGQTLISSSAESSRIGTLWNLSMVSPGIHNFTFSMKIGADIPNNTLLTITAVCNYTDSRGYILGNASASAAVTVLTEPFKPLPPPQKPNITETFPATNQKDVLVYSTIRITFSHLMNLSTVQSSFTISPPVEGTFSVSGNNILFTPLSKLAEGKRYTITVNEYARDSAGTPLDKTYTWSFTTTGKITQTIHKDYLLPLLIISSVIIGIVAVAVLATRRKKGIKESVAATGSSGVSRGPQATAEPAHSSETSNEAPKVPQCIDKPSPAPAEKPDRSAEEPLVSEANFPPAEAGGVTRSSPPPIPPGVKAAGVPANFVKTPTEQAMEPATPAKAPETASRIASQPTETQPEIPQPEPVKPEPAPAPVEKKPSTDDELADILNRLKS